MLRRTVIWWLCCGVLLTPVRLLACGAFFSTVVAEPISAPQHRAIIVHHEGKETLILQESFAGLDQDFAWVIPTPAYPAVALAAPDLFTTLHLHTQPLSDAETTPWLLLALVLASVFVTLVIYRTFRIYPCVILLCCLSLAALLFASPEETVSPGVPLNIYFAVPLSLAMLLALGFRLRVGTFVGLLFLVLLSAVTLLPTFFSLYRPSGSTPSSANLDAVTVHERKQVGLYDISILSAHEPDALLRWLQQHGYQRNAQGEAIIKEYVQHGWFFIATRIRPSAEERDRSNTTAAAAIQEYRQRGGLFLVPRLQQSREDGERPQRGDVPPLQVSFAAAKPIYPLKLAALGPSEAEIVLYVFAPMQVQADGFTVTFADQAQHESLGVQRMFDPSVIQLVPSGFYLTKLEAKLAPGVITADVEITVSRSQKAYRLTRYSYEVLQWMAIDGGLLGSLLTIVLLCYGGKMTARARSHAMASSASVVVGLLIAFCFYYVTPPVPTAHMVWCCSSRKAAVSTAEGIRAALASYAADSPDNRYPPTAVLASYTDLVRLVNANGGTLPASEKDVFFAGYTPDGDENYTLILAVGVVLGGITDTILVVTPEGITRCQRGDCR